MLRHLAAKRLLPQTLVITPIRRTLVARPVAPCSWSKRDEVLSNWEALRANPNEWYDNRKRKTNPKAPDFVRKDDRSVAIWIDGRDTPEWYGELLEELDSRQGGQRRGDRFGEDRFGGDRSGGDRNDRRAAEMANWESLRNNPEEWFDNRSRKTNPRAPDFRRKDDRAVALWLDSYGAPEWLGDLLQELDARQSQRSTGYSQQQQGGYQQAPDEDKRAAELAKWDSLRSNPELWFDNRRTKTNPKAPDFKLKSDRSVALWLSSYQLPDYLDDLLAELDARYEQRMSGQQQYQQQQDYQPYPEQQQGYADYTQQQQQQSYQQYDSREAKIAQERANWESLRDYPDQWFDNRYTKQNPKAPDFRKRDDRSVALWLTSRSVPEWINELLPELDARYQQREAARSGYSAAPEAVY